MVGLKVLTRCLVCRGLFVVGSSWERGHSQGETNLHNEAVHWGL